MRCRCMCSFFPVGRRKPEVLPQILTEGEVLRLLRTSQEFDVTRSGFAKSVGLGWNGNAQARR
jgi:hypothetical protein